MISFCIFGYIYIQSEIDCAHDCVSALFVNDVFDSRTVGINDSLTTVRKLKEKGVEVYFQKENIYTLDSKGELLITIMSSLAQEESRSISENVTWGQRKGFCLEYDFQSILKECTQNCIDIRCCNNFMLNYSLAPIIYTKERFDATAYFSTVMQALLYEKNQIPMDLYYEDILIVSKCMLTKSIDWEYENEWRLFTPNFNDEYKPYRKIASLRPVALYMGAKITKENESVLYEVCKNKGIKCFKMLQDFHGKEFIVRAEPYEKIIDVVNSNFHDK